MMNEVKISELPSISSIDQDGDFIPVIAADHLRKIRAGNFAASLSNLNQMTGGRLLVVNNDATSTGDVDLYTVPVGYKYFVFAGSAINMTGSSISTNFKWQCYLDGAYRAIGSRTASPFSSGGSGNNLLPIIIEAGEKIGYNVSVAGLNVMIRGLLIPSSTNVKSPRLTTVASTNTLYTCPAGKVAIPCVYPFFSSGLSYVFSNYTGSTVGYVVHIIKNGDTPVNANKVANLSALTNSSTTLTTFAGLNAGDYVYFTSTSTASGQTAWLNILELDV